MRITSKGQVTIPREIREKAGFLPGTEVDFILQEDGVVRLCPGRRKTRNPKVTEAIRRLRGSARGRMGTDEIMALTRG